MKNPAHPKLQPHIEAAHQQLYRDCFGFLSKLKVTAIAGIALAALPIGGERLAIAIGCYSLWTIWNDRQRFFSHQQRLNAGDTKTLRKYTAPDQQGNLLDTLAELNPATPAPKRGLISQIAAPLFKKEKAAPKTPTQQDKTTLKRELTGYPSLLIFGASGAGKTAFVSRILSDRSQAGHKIMILDPHSYSGAWGQHRTIGQGFNYAAISVGIRETLETVKSRYGDRSHDSEFEPLTICCDEFTDWADEVPEAGKLMKASLSHFRKINLHLIVISHDRTLKSLGDLTGFSGLRDRGLLEVELFNQPDPITGKSIPTFTGQVKRPGKEFEPMDFGPELFQRDAQSTPVTPPETAEPPVTSSRHVTPSRDRVADHVPQPPETCPECSSPEIVGNGSNPNGTKRRKCKTCNHSWTVTPPNHPTEPLPFTGLI